MTVPDPSLAVPRSARAILRAGTERLTAAGVANAAHESAWLLSGLTGVGPTELYLQEPRLSEGAVTRFFEQISARAAGMPLQYLLAEAAFCGERFRVGPGVFIPRPETEAVVEAALQALRMRQAEVERPLRLLDLGTGSGCIALTLARALPTCVVIGVELSWVSLRTACANGARLGLSGRVAWVQGRWLEGIRGPMDGVISNPPYIPTAQVDRLPLEVRREPRLALDGGGDGMQELRALMAQVPRVLASGGVVALECGEDQVEPMRRRAHAASWVETATALTDLAGRPRGIVLTRT